MVAGALDRYSDLVGRRFLLARQVNFETIHNHDVIAERHGVVVGAARRAGRPSARG